MDGEHPNPHRGQATVKTKYRDLHAKGLERVRETFSQRVKSKVTTRAGEIASTEDLEIAATHPG